jgi:hypothetical protein
MAVASPIDAVYPSAAAEAAPARRDENNKINRGSP